MTAVQNPELDLAYKYAQYTHRNIFLTGKAGTGKTTFLRHLRMETHKRNIVVAPTGVAAINAGGMTIHSFFQLAPGLYLPGQHIQRDARNRYGFSKHKINILRSLDLLIIDEISMVRCDLLDAIDDVLRRYQDHFKPFGGVQLLMIGDLQQLAPVASDEEWTLLEQNGYQTPYFFGSKALQQTNYTAIELTHVFRQADSKFVNLLNNVRDNHLDAETLRLLNSRYNPSFHPSDDDGYITLTTHDYQANAINKERLEQLPGKPYIFSATVKGDFPEGSYPTDAQLTLKIGAQVMFCKNDPNHKYYNGKIGRITQIVNDEVWVESPDENGTMEDLLITAQAWQNSKYVTDEGSGEIKEEVIGTFTQIPLRTAWAITIHKSQGLTFDHCIVNAGQAFSFGQVYVALSRCRTLEGLVLSTPITGHVVMSDPTILSYNQAMQENMPDEKQLTLDRRNCVEQTLCSIFDYLPLMIQFRHLLRQADELLPKAHNAYVEQMKTVVQGCETHLEKVGITFQNQIHQLVGQFDTYEENKLLQERVKKGNNYFLIKTTELMDDFIQNGLPTIENKRTKEVLTREFELLKQDYQIKTRILIRTANGFSLDNYWNAKAEVTMQESAVGQPGYTGKETKKVKSTRKKKNE